MVEERETLVERMKTLKNMLYNAKLTQPEEESFPVIELGNTVTFVALPGGKKETYTIIETPSGKINVQIRDVQ